MDGLSRLGDEIYGLRKVFQMSQADLSSQLCTQALISKVENGMILPSPEILYSISKKLRTPIINLIEVMLYERIDYYHSLFEILEFYSYKKAYLEIYRLTKKELKNPSLKSIEITNYLKKFYIVASYYCGEASFEMTVDALKSILNIEQQFHYYTYYIILNDLANIYSNEQNYNLSYPIYHEIISSSLTTKEFLSFKVKVFYDQAITYFREERILLSMDSCKEGIRLSKKIYCMKYLGELWGLLAKIMESLHYNENKVSYYKLKSNFIQKLLDNNIESWENINFNNFKLAFLSEVGETE